MTTATISQRPTSPRTWALGQAEQVELLRSVLEATTECAIVALDLDGRVVAWNEGAWALYGHEASEVLGAGAPFLHAHTPQAEHAKRLWSAARTKGHAVEQLPSVRKDGGQFLTQVSVLLCHDASGEAIGCLWTAKELGAEPSVQAQLQAKDAQIAELTQRLEQLERSNRETLSDMSHELRTPLNGIIGFSELLQRGDAGSITELQAEYLADIFASAKHLLELINRLCVPRRPER